MRQVALEQGQLRTSTDARSAFRPLGAPLDSLRDSNMAAIKDLFTLVPVVILTVAGVLAIATLMSLSSWALL